MKIAPRDAIIQIDKIHLLTGDQLLEFAMISLPPPLSVANFFSLHISACFPMYIQSHDDSYCLNFFEPISLCVDFTGSHNNHK